MASAVELARGSYGAVEGGTDSDHTVNGNQGLTNAPNKGVLKRGVMGVNFGVTLAAVTDGTSNTAFFSEMRLWSGDDRHSGNLGDGLCRGEPLL